MSAPAAGHPASRTVCGEFIVVARRRLHGEGGKSSSLLRRERREGTEKCLVEQHMAWRSCI